MIDNGALERALLLSVILFPKPLYPREDLHNASHHVVPLMLDQAGTLTARSPRRARENVGEEYRHRFALKAKKSRQKDGEAAFADCPTDLKAEHAFVMKDALTLGEKAMLGS